MRALGRGLMAFVAMATLVAGIVFLVPIERLSWTGAILLIVGYVVGIYLFICFAVGYSGTSARELDQFRRLTVWHVAPEPRDLVEGRLHLDPSHCRWRSMVWRRDRSWLRPRRAVFLFTTQPTLLDRWRNVSQNRAGYLYELDGTELPENMLVRDNEIAVPQSLNLRVVSQTTMTTS